MIASATAPMPVPFRPLRVVLVTAMSTAIFGLVGVVVGGLITGGIDWFMERRRERKALQAALRLVRGDLIDSASTIEATKVSGTWWDVAGGDLRSNLWNEQRAIVAAGIKEAVDYEALAFAFAEIEIWRDERVVRAEHGAGRNFDAQEDGPRLDHTVDTLRKVVAITGQLADDL